MFILPLQTANQSSEFAESQELFRTPSIAKTATLYVVLATK